MSLLRWQTVAGDDRVEACHIVCEVCFIYPNTQQRIIMIITVYQLSRMGCIIFDSQTYCFYMPCG